MSVWRTEREPWWLVRGLAKDPDTMTPDERDEAQMQLLEQWLFRRAVQRRQLRQSDQSQARLTRIA